MRWQIYNKSNTLICETNNITYSGEWMGDEFVTTTIKSATPIDFEIGDYIQYRNEKFYLSVIPTAKKEARRSSTSEAFVYDSVKFYSCIDEIIRCKFLDKVLEQNSAYYTGLPDFTFYANSVIDLADRVKANLDRLYTGDKTWTVKVYTGNDTFYTSGVSDISDHSKVGGNKNIQVSVNNLNVWGALALCDSEFDLNFVTRGHTIIIGDTGDLLTKFFSYGKDNGLCKIERTTDDTQQIVTRLRAYGNTTNIPVRYYHKQAETLGITLPDNLNCLRLMLPSFPNTSLDPHIDSANIGSLGVREETIYFDGSDGRKDIYPSIEWSGNNYVTVGSTITDNGIFDQKTTLADFKITIADIGFNIKDCETSSGEPTLSMKDGMCGAREFPIKGCVKNSDNTYTLTLGRVQDSSLDMYFPNCNYPIRAKSDNFEGDKFVILNIDMPKEIVEKAAERLEAEARAWLAKNDYAVYKYSLEVDEVFMQRQHDEAIANSTTSIHNTIKAGDVMHFTDTDLAISANISIDKIEIKEGEEFLPKYSITLAEDKTVGTIQRLQNKIDSIANNNRGGGYNISEIETIIKNYGKKAYISKTDDDTAEGKVTFKKGIETDDIASKGGFDGADNSDLQEGFSLSVKTNGQGQKYSQLDVFNANIHGKLSVETLEIRETEYVKGEQVITVGGGFKCTKVEDVLTDGAVSGVKCYFLQKDSEGNERHNAFKANDLAYCKNWEENASGNPSRYFWRKVTDVGTDYIVVAYSENDIATNTLLGDKPIVGDTIVQLGTCGTNASGNARNKTIVLSSVRSGAPCLVMYENVHDWQWGDPTSKISPEEVLFIAEKFKIATSSGNKTLSAIMEEYNTKFQNINSQLDESFQIWHVDYNAPTNSSGVPVAPTIETYEPSKYWASTTYSEHEGDFIVTLDGIVYEFVKLDEIWQWKIVTDKYLVSAVTQINSINATLDNMASDSVITREEYPSLKKIWEKEKSDYTTLTEKAALYKLATIETYASCLTSYQNKYDSLNTIIEAISSSLLSNESVNVPDEWSNAWSQYWTQKTLLEKVLTQASQAELGNVKSELSSGIAENGDAIQSLTQKIEGTDTEQGLIQRIGIAEGNITTLDQTLSQKVNGYTYNELIQKVIDVDGQVNDVEGGIVSRIGDVEASVRTTVKRNNDGTITSKIKLTSNTLEINSDEFTLNENGALFSGDVKIGGTKQADGDILNPKILLAHAGSGHIAGGNISWNENGDVTFKLKGINFDFDDTSQSQKALKWLLEAFEFVTSTKKDSEGNTLYDSDGEPIIELVAVNCKYDFWSSGSIAAYGKAQSSGSGSTSTMFPITKVFIDNLN